MKLIIILFITLSLSSCVEITKVGCFESEYYGNLFYNHSNKLYYIQYNVDDFYDLKDSNELYGKPSESSSLVHYQSYTKCPKLSISKTSIKPYKRINHYESIMKAIKENNK